MSVCLLQSLLCLGHITSIAVTPLSVIAEDVIGCRVVVELRSRVYMLGCVHPSKCMLHKGQIYLGYVSLSCSGRVLDSLFVQ